MLGVPRGYLAGLTVYGILPSKDAQQGRGFSVQKGPCHHYSMTDFSTGVKF